LSIFEKIAYLQVGIGGKLNSQGCLKKNSIFCSIGCAFCSKVSKNVLIGPIIGKITKIITKK